MEVLHQQCRGGGGANHRQVNRALVLFKRIVVGGDGFKSTSVVPREGFG